MPAIWMHRLRRARDATSTFRFTTRHLLILMTALAICLMGYVQAGTAGAVTVSAIVIAVNSAVLLWRDAAASGRASAVCGWIAGSGMLLIAAYLAYLYADRCLNLYF
jgi:hypothetical protein